MPLNPQVIIDAPPEKIVKISQNTLLVFWFSHKSSTAGYATLQQCMQATEKKSKAAAEIIRRVFTYTSWRLEFQTGFRVAHIIVSVISGVAIYVRAGNFNMYSRTVGTINVIANYCLQCIFNLNSILYHLLIISELIHHLYIIHSCTHYCNIRR